MDAYNQMVMALRNYKAQKVQGQGLGGGGRLGVDGGMAPSQTKAGAAMSVREAQARLNALGVRRGRAGRGHGPEDGERAAGVPEGQGPAGDGAAGRGHDRRARVERGHNGSPGVALHSAPGGSPENANHRHARLPHVALCPGTGRHSRRRTLPCRVSAWRSCIHPARSRPPARPPHAAGFSRGAGADAPREHLLLRAAAPVPPETAEDGTSVLSMLWHEGERIYLVNLVRPGQRYQPVEDSAGEGRALASSSGSVDLKTDVVPTEADVGSSTTLVSRAWVERLKAQCRRVGTTIRVSAFTPRRTP